MKPGGVLRQGKSKFKCQVTVGSWEGCLFESGGGGQEREEHNLFLSAPGKWQDSCPQLLELAPLWSRAPVPFPSACFTQEGKPSIRILSRAFFQQLIELAYPSPEALSLDLLYPGLGMASPIWLQGWGT